MFKMNKKTIIIIASILLIVLAFFVIDKFITGKIIKEIPDTDWLVENCNCTEKQRLFCGEGFELKEGICKNSEGWTNPFRGCSIYECFNGEVYEIK